MIKFENVKVAFKQKNGEFVAVKDVSLHIEAGDIYGIVGGSGAGKSTLVRTINGLQQPTQGHIFVDNEDITQLNNSQIRELRKKVGMIFQHFNLVSRKTVGQNIELALKIQEYPKEKRKARVEELLELVGLKDKLNAYPASLSGGQKQRVGIARALATNPKILLCDEATSALDAQTTVEIVDILKQINSSLGITIVFITHQMEVAKNLFTKVAVMSEGEIIEHGTTYEVFANPQAELTKKLVETQIDIPDKIISKTQGKIIKLTYKGNRSVEPIVAYANKKYEVVLNILHGRIEYITEKPIGVLVVSIIGEAHQIDKALEYIKANTEGIEVIREKGSEVA
ncbi:methionine ABC transporter ATP-binding protein [Cellulosilyticum ruminicola]|uniref:methionine ABC transporter ATP-binding protein n=1 Tax=Cellulosilyticum ruminicola TaxID=425254 RepID=UPI0006CFFAAF|nr:ATP-binding cassette domain-containing protein [Cellulosilyticum ruminicola]